MNRSSNQPTEETEELQRMLDCSLDVICSLDQAGNFVKLNSACRTLWGYPPEELHGRSYLSLVAAQDQDFTSQIIAMALAGSKSIVFENWCVRRDGSLVPVSWSVSWSEQYQRMLCVCRDVTATSVAEQSLAEAQNVYGLLFYDNPQPMWVVDLETDTFLDVNTAALKQYEYNRREFLMLTLWAIRPEEDFEEFRKLMQSPAYLEGRHHVVNRHLTKNGQRIWVEVIAYPVLFKGRKARLAVATNVTERVRQEKELALIKKAIAYSTDAIGIESFSDNTFYFNQALLTLLSYSAAELQRLGGVSALFVDQELERTIRELVRGDHSWTGTSQLYDVNRRVIDVQMRVVAILDEDRLIGLTYVFAGLQGQMPRNEEMSEVLQSITEGFYRLNRQWEFEYINPAAERLLQQISQNLLGKSLWDVFPPRPESPLHRVFHQAMDTNQVVHHQQYYAPSNTWFDIKLVPSSTGLSVHLRDITGSRFVELFSRTEREVWKRNASGTESLESLTQFLMNQIEQIAAGVCCSVWLLDQQRTALQPLAWSTQLNNYIAYEGSLIIAESQRHPASLAVYSRQPVLIIDMVADASWPAGVILTQELGLHACWAYPIQTANHELLGILSVYCQQSRAPQTQDQTLIEQILLLLQLLIESRQAQEQTQINNERYRRVTQVTNDAIWDMDITTGQISYGDNYENLFGMATTAADQLASWISRVGAEDQARVVSSLFSVIDSPDASQWEEEYRFQRKDGSWADVYDRGVLIRNQAGYPIRMIGAMQDITKRRQSESHLKLLESVITNASDAIVIMEAEPRSHSTRAILYVNPAFTAMTGYTFDEIRRKGLPALTGPRTDRKETRKLERKLRNWEPFSTELVYYKKSGEEFWVNAAFVPVTNGDGLYTHWISIQRDVTRQKESEAELKLLSDELFRQYNDLKQFSYITSHNLRAPVANLLGLLNLYDKTNPESELNPQIIDELGEAAQQLNTTLSDLTSVLVIKSDVNQPQEKLRFETVVKRVLASIQNLVQEAGAKVDCHFSQAPTVRYNRLYLESILSNLLTNALKYRSPQRPLHIRMTSFLLDDFVVLDFEDNGIGIDLTRHGHKIFGLYQRFHNHPDSKGLGLYMVKSQIVALGGRIEVESQVDGGTRFRIYLKK